MVGTASVEQRVESISSRLASLEARIRDDSTEANNSGGGSSVEARLDLLEEEMNRVLISSSSNDNSKDWNECEKMFKVLIGGGSDSNVALAVGTSVSNDPLSIKNAPIFFRRQEILASVDEFKKNIEMLKTIDANAVPINTLMSDDGWLEAAHLGDYQNRADVVEKRIGGVASRLNDVSQRVDRLIATYHTVIMAMSEKIVLFDEELTCLSAQHRKNKLN